MIFQEKAIDLITQFQYIQSKAMNYIEKMEDFTPDNETFKVGDVIEFYSGFNSDILYKSKILGFNKQGQIFVLWNCYWSPLNVDIAKPKLIIRLTLSAKM